MGWEDAPIVQSAAQTTGWEAAPIIYPGQRTRVAKGVSEAWEAGWQGSIPGLVDRGRLPDIVLDSKQNAWYERLAGGVSQLFHETPESVAGMLAGGAAGTAVMPGPGTIVGAGAGAFAVPTAIRESLIQYYEQRDGVSSADFLARSKIVLQKTGKDAVVGGLTAGLGKAAQVGLAPVMGQRVMAGTMTASQARLATDAGMVGAELGALIVTPAALEGRLPEVQDFTDAAILLVGLKSAGAAAGKLRTVFAKTGKTPMEVMADAKADPTIIEDLAKTAETAAKPEAESKGRAGEQLDLSKDDLAIPRAYQELARQNVIEAALGPRNAGFEPKVAEVMANPQGTITVGKEPNHINYAHVDAPQDVMAVQARIAEVFKAEIEAKRGTESWAQTQEKAAEVLRGMKPEDLATADLTDLAAKTMATQAMAQRAAFDLADISAKIREAGKAGATPEMLAKQAEAIEMLAALHAFDQGNGAALARALNARKAAKNVSALSGEAAEMLAKYGDDPHKLAEMVGELGTAEQMARFAEKASKATTWEKVVEAWKSGLVSGPITQIANVLGNVTFAATRPLVDAVALPFSALRGGPERMSAVEPLARVIGNIHGVIDGAKTALAVLKTGDNIATGKTEARRKAIEGPVGEVVRIPFRLLGAGDAFFRVVNERGEAYTLATREAAKEGFNPATREFRERVAEIAANPTDKMIEQIEAAGTRFTFNAPLGEKGQAIQKGIRKLHLEWAIPFVQTPANVAKEMLRLTPAAPVIKEWREAIAKGGPEADKAIAEMVVGTAVGTAVFSMALSGNISGAGDPDPKKRASDLAAGWQPYSVKIGGKWYSYQRLQPVGTLIGMSADAASVWEHMTPEERDKTPKILSTAFSHAITEQTFLQGITNIVDAISQPDRKGAKFVQNMAASTIPALVGQSAQMIDPYQREVYSVLDAVKARIPGAREGLMPTRDIFGQVVEAKDRMGAISPITTTTPTTDKVRAEAARLNVGVEKAPDHIELPSGRDSKLGKVALTPEQRDVFATKSGQMAYQILSNVVQSPMWDKAPDMVQRQTMQKVFEQSREFARKTALSPEQLQAELQRISTELGKRLQPK